MNIIIFILLFSIVLMYYIYSLFKPIKITRIPARNNWKGIPPPDLTWEEVRDGTEKILPITPFTIEVCPKTCPVCNNKLIEYRSAWYEHDPEYGGQYDVVGVYCECGEYTHLTWA